MLVNGTHHRSIWRDAQTGVVRILDQRWLPHRIDVATLQSLDDFATAIRDMWVRGAPLIGATAAYGIAEQMANGQASLVKVIIGAAGTIVAGLLSTIVVIIMQMG